MAESIHWILDLYLSYGRLNKPNNTHTPLLYLRITLEVIEGIWDNIIKCNLRAAACNVLFAVHMACNVLFYCRYGNVIMISPR